MKTLKEKLAERILDRKIDKWGKWFLGFIAIYWLGALGLSLLAMIKIWFIKI